MACVGSMEEEDSHLVETEDVALLAQSPEGQAPGDSQSAAPSPKVYHSHTARELSDKDKSLLQKQDTRIVTEFKQKKLETEAQKNWDLFYKRNTTKFFKDRHWTTREFEDLCGQKISGAQLTILEVGCGVGNFMFPLLEEMKDVRFFACDFSPRAVQFVQDNEKFDAGRCKAFQCDLTKDPLTSNIKQATVDIVSMIFVLSAIHPNKMFQALRNVHSVLKPGGCVLFRDYGLYDHAQLRFSPGHKLSENSYYRQDGTRAYYFSTEHMSNLMTNAGFEVTSNEYVLRETVNKKEGLCVPRVFVQAKFIKKVSAEPRQAPINFITEPAATAVSMPGDLNNSNNDLGSVS